jgi:hypothetical protein
VKARNGSLERKRLKYSMSGSPESAWKSKHAGGFLADVLAVEERRWIMMVRDGDMRRVAARWNDRVPETSGGQFIIQFRCRKQSERRMR